MKMNDSFKQLWIILTCYLGKEARHKMIYVEWFHLYEFQKQTILFRDTEVKQGNYYNKSQSGYC